MKTTLFDLVQSLSTPERSFVKKFLLRHVINNTSDMATLFDAVAEMDDYNEALLRERCVGERFLRRLPAAKNELVALILRAMRGYQQQQSWFQEITYLMQDAHFLTSRGLYVQAREVTTKLLEVCRTVGDPTFYLKALMLQATLIRSSREYNADEVAALDAELRDVAADVQLVADTEGLETLLSANIVCGAPLSHEHNRRLSENLEQAQRPQRSPYIAIQRLHVASSFAQFFGQGMPLAYQLELQIQDVYDNNPEYAERFPRSQLHSLINAAALAVLAGHEDEAAKHEEAAWAALDSIRSIFTASALRDLEMRLITTTLHRMLSATTPQNSEAELLRIRKHILLHAAAQPTSVALVALLNLSVVAFYSGHLAFTIATIAKARPFPKTVRPDVHDGLELLSIMAHFEQGDFSLCESKARSFRRRIARGGTAMSPDVDAFLGVVMRLCQYPTPKHRTALLREGITRIEAVRSATSGRVPTDMVGPTHWFRRLLGNKA